MVADIRYGFLEALVLLVSVPAVLGDESKNVAREVTIQLSLRIALPIVLGGLFSLGAFIFFKFCYKPKAKVAAISPHPEWASTLDVDAFGASSGFSACSEDITILARNVIARTCQKCYHTDAARWSSPLQGGRHVFEVVWGRPDRGVKATIGVGTLNTPLSVKGVQSLVGDLPTTWGLDLVRRRTLHAGKVLGVCPSAGFIPDKFNMYLDLDEGTVGFGTDEHFWGFHIKGLPRTEPLYVMVGMTQPNGTMQLFYRGKADPLKTGAGPSVSVIVSADPIPQKRPPSGQDTNGQTQGPSTSFGMVPPPAVYYH